METNFVEKKSDKDKWVDLNNMYLNYTKNPNMDSLNNLIIAFQPFITALANDFASSLEYCNCDFEDLQQEANLYLFKIIQNQNYVFNSKTSFTSYCYSSLANKLKRLLNKASTPFNIDTYGLNKLKAIRNYYNLGDKSNLTNKDIKKYQPVNFISLNLVIGTDENGKNLELGELIPVDETEETHNKLDFEFLIKKIKQIIPNLNFNILFDKYINELELSELSNKYNMSKKEIQANLSKSIKLIQTSIKR